MTVNLLTILGKTRILSQSLDDVNEMYDESKLMFDLAWEALESHDKNKAQQVVGKDQKVDRLEVKVREEVLTYLESMPAGGNVPLSLILIDTANQLERMADHIVFIADSALKYPCMDEDDEFTKALRTQRELVKGMVDSVSSALAHCDESEAENVLGSYQQLKQMFESYRKDVAGSNIAPARAVGLVLVSRDLLRIGKKSKCIMEFCLKPYPEAGE